MASFNKYYQDELAFLRELGQEFADDYPSLAPALGKGSYDPDVERLLEGVAFLTGRIRQKLDDEFPEAIFAITQLLIPSMLRPIPAAAILQLSPLPNTLRQRLHIPKGTEFAAREKEGVSAIFTSRVNWDLWPVDLLNVSVGTREIRLDFEALAPITAVARPDAFLRFHVSGERQRALSLLLHCSEYLDDVVFESDAGKKVSVGKAALRPMGFGAEDCLLPEESELNPGIRLLQEYYALPEKFCFLELGELSALKELGPKLKKFQVILRFDSSLPAEWTAAEELLRLNCLPVLNLFEASAEPVRPKLERHEYLVRVADYPRHAADVYRINRVEAIERGTNQRFEIPDFFSFDRLGSNRSGAFYTTHIRPALRENFAEVSLSLGSSTDQQLPFEAELLSLELLATNRNLASTLQPGDICIPTRTSPATLEFRNISSPTGYVPPVLGRELQWRTLAHSAMNLNTFSDVNVLRTAIGAYNVHSTVDQKRARVSELRQSALTKLKFGPTSHLYRGTAVRGVRLDLEVDDRGFSGPGDAYLFGKILSHFFASYVSINSFVQFNLQSTPSRLEFSWPPQSGSHALLLSSGSIARVTATSFSS